MGRRGRFGTRQRRTRQLNHSRNRPAWRTPESNSEKIEIADRVVCRACDGAGWVLSRSGARKCLAANTRWVVIEGVSLPGFGGAR